MALEATNISVDLGGRAVLRDVSLRLNAGEIVAVLGANGAGKTTLLRALNRTVEIASGDIIIGESDGGDGIHSVGRDRDSMSGNSLTSDSTQDESNSKSRDKDGKNRSAATTARSVSTMSRREIARAIAVVAQENETKFPVTVREFVLAGRFVRGAAFGWETAADVDAADAALAKCDLAEFGGRLMNELSGGERQRVVLARAIAAESSVLLLDEPTANLDIAHQALMFRLVRERCRELGVAAAVITHDLNLASEFADRVVLLKDGKVFAQGTPGETLTTANIAAVFAMNVLLDTNPASGRARVTTIF